MAKVKYPISDIYYECLCAFSMKKHNTIRPTDVRSQGGHFLSTYLKAYIDKKHFNKKELEKVNSFLSASMHTYIGINFTEFKRKKICQHFLQK